jgi:hypothetical protein
MLFCSHRLTGAEQLPPWPRLELVGPRWLDSSSAETGHCRKAALP